MQTNLYSKKNAFKGALHYLLGRAGSAIGGFAVVILLVRYMDVDNYAAYTALSGLITFSGILANLGIERVISRYIPEARINRTVYELGRLILITSVVRLIAIFLVVFVLYLCWSELDKFLAVMKFNKFTIAMALFILAESMFQHFSSILQALLMQNKLAWMMTIQWSGRLLMIAYFELTLGTIDWVAVLWIFAIPETVGVLGFIICIAWYLHNLTISNTEQSLVSDLSKWPDWSMLMKVGMHNYGFSLLVAPPQGYFIKMLSAAFLPAEVVAAYGFFINIAEKIRQYIPLNFFYGIIEPMMIAAYLKDNDFSALSIRCQMLYKSNLLIMVPIIIWLALCGDTVVNVLSGHKFDGLWWILLVIMVQFTIGCHIILLQLILNTLQKSSILLSASAFALLVFILIMVYFVNYSPIYMFYIPTIFSLILNVYIVTALSKTKYLYKPSFKMLSGIILSGLVTYIIIQLALLVGYWNLPDIFVAAIIFMGVLVVFSLVIWKANIFDKNEVQYIKSVFEHKKSLRT